MIVDLRSDTITQPTDEMREAMRNADVGSEGEPLAPQGAPCAPLRDDACGDDPTVNRLEAMAAHAEITAV